MTKKKLNPQVAGRPTKYAPEYCDGIVAFMGEGYSMTAYAGEIGVCRDTLVEWGDQHPEFSDAIKRGKAKRTQRLEEGLLSSDVGPRITARIFALKNAAPDEWKDKRETEMSGPGGGPVQHHTVIENVIVDPKER